VNAGTTSLLRLLPTVSGRLVLLGLVFLAFSAPGAAVAAPAPDPSPSGGSAQPDPFPPSPKPQAPAHVFVPSAPTRTPTPATPVRAEPAVRPKHKHRAAASPARTVIRSRRPDTPASSIAGGLVSAVDSGRNVSTGVALAVAMLVLLSGALIAGAAREVAR
jgi:hypothetical protein